MASSVDATVDLRFHFEVVQANGAQLLHLASVRHEAVRVDGPIHDICVFLLSLTEFTAKAMDKPRFASGRFSNTYQRFGMAEWMLPWRLRS